MHAMREGLAGGVWRVMERFRRHASLPRSTCSTTSQRRSRATRSALWPTAPPAGAGLIRHFRPSSNGGIEEYRGRRTASGGGIRPRDGPLRSKIGVRRKPDPPLRRRSGDKWVPAFAGSRACGLPGFAVPKVTIDGRRSRSRRGRRCCRPVSRPGSNPHFVPRRADDRRQLRMCLVEVEKSRSRRPPARCRGRRAM